MDVYTPRPDRQVRSLLTQWGLARDDVPAAILSSSQVVPGARGKKSVTHWAIPTHWRSTGAVSHITGG